MAHGHREAEEGTGSTARARPGARDSAGFQPMKAYASLEEATRILASLAKPIVRVESANLLDARGRVAAKAVVATLDVPPFARAAMDGYAVRAEDTYGAGRLKSRTLRVLEVIHAGQLGTRKVGEGEATQIATGAPMPSGANAVVMVEETERNAGNVMVNGAVHPGENVSPAGEDVRRGTIVVKALSVLTPARIGVCAALGFRDLAVFAKPKVAVLPSGDEVRPPGIALEPGAIYDVNSYTLATLVEEHGCEATLFPVVPDELDAVREALEKAAATHDVVIISGGSSVGERDLVIDAIRALGTLHVHGIAVKPGKPTLVGTVGTAMVLGMPGYPTSCLTNGYGFVVPALRAMARLPAWQPRVVELPMARRVTSTVGRHQYLPVRVENGEALPVYKESGAITSMSEADGFIEIPANVDLVEKGEVVRVVLF